MVAHLIWDQGAAGSNPVVPTKIFCCTEFHNGVSPSGKATVSEIVTQWFESIHPSQKNLSISSRGFSFLCVFHFYVIRDSRLLSCTPFSSRFAVLYSLIRFTIRRAILISSNKPTKPVPVEEQPSPRAGFPFFDRILPTDAT